MNKLIRAIAPHCIREFHLSELKGKRLVVDALIFIYEVKYRMKITKSTFLHTFQQKLKLLIEHTTEIIFVFDGKKVKEKNYTVWKRKMDKQKLKLKIKNTRDISTSMNLERQLVEVHPKDIYEAKDVLKQKGLMIVQSLDEGEATCVKLVKEGFADFILTNDTDALPFGSSYIHRKCRKIDEQNSSTSYLFTDLPQLIKELGFENHIQFVDMSILLGCDFSDPLKKLVYHKIPGFVREFKTLETFLANAVKLNLPYFTTERNSPNALLKSKSLFINILGDYVNYLPLNHREYHLQIISNEEKKKNVVIQSSLYSTTVGVRGAAAGFLSNKTRINGGEKRGVFQEPFFL